MCENQACVACAGDFGASGAACPSSAPLCASNGECGRCQGDSDCVGNAAGSICSLTTGACGSTCASDANCASGSFCGADQLCSAKLGNGAPVPGGVCSAELGARACVSGVCSTSNNQCGLGSSDACSAAAQCQSGICAPSGACGTCNQDSECGGGSSGQICDDSSKLCVAGCRSGGNACPAGEMCSSSVGVGSCVSNVADGGVDAGSDAGVDSGVDAGSDAGVDSGAGDSGSVDSGHDASAGNDSGSGSDSGSNNDGSVLPPSAAAGCGCSVQSKNDSLLGLFASLGFVSLALANRKRSRR